MMKVSEFTKLTQNKLYFMVKTQQMNLINYFGKTVKYNK